ncbi:MAG: SDR family NAD(P)-dependent oxidoreductase [Nitrospira sp.]|nr:SDR family NAD(P)-dependent oxidoreductase [Nitrospira sp.]
MGTSQRPNEQPPRPDPEIVVVTGAAAGIGLAIVREFAQRRAWIGLIARNRTRLESVQEEVEAAGGRAVVLVQDVANTAEVEDAAEGWNRNVDQSTSGSTMRWCPSYLPRFRCMPAPVASCSILYTTSGQQADSHAQFPSIPCSLNPCLLGHSIAENHLVDHIAALNATKGGNMPSERIILSMIYSFLD